ncbi:MAG: sugar transferase, partial [Bacteroidota bacterium]
GLRNSLIIGWNAKARELYDMVADHSALGYKVVGFIKVDRRKGDGQHRGVRTQGSVEKLHEIIASHDVKEILIALDSSEHDKLLGIIQQCNSSPVGLKIMPDLYDVISGQARTNQIYGFPLIEISPEIMPPWEQSVKRLIDITVSLFVLILTLPFSLLIALAIKVDSQGPVFYNQERVGKAGRLFRIMKFRSMFREAEQYSGPVWANKRDPRITRIGRVIRKLRLDEIPQFINVLAGDMSFVGPRPERPYFVEKFSREVPLYARRLKVRPGITGWAQVKHKYDETLEDVKKKVWYDLFYIENMSLRMDFKILLNTVYVILIGKGH